MILNIYDILFDLRMSAIYLLYLFQFIMNLFVYKLSFISFIYNNQNENKK